MDIVVKKVLLVVLLQGIQSGLSYDMNESSSNIVDVAFDYIYKTFEDAPTELLTDPQNNLNSIPYALYTPSNPKEACYIEPTPEEFDHCSFNSSYNTQILIHGFAEILKPGNLFDELKDALLDYDNYNTIIVNWTLYNNFPLVVAINDIPRVGKRVSEMMQFIINHTGADPGQFHCIGHSLGAHICGHATRRIPNVRRVTGLDPGGITIVELFEPNIILKNTDADYVDIIHTSSIITGLGLGTIVPIGDMDFYVNGGIFQKHCVFGNKYQVFKGDVLKVWTILDPLLCDHFISIKYFTNSVREGCEFIGTKCDNFLYAILNPIVTLCPSNPNITARMGFHSEKIPGLPPRSVFYVDTLEFPPYCKEQSN